jgi:hypothetical protein
MLERLTASSEVATVQGSIPASSDTVESEGLTDSVWGEVVGSGGGATMPPMPKTDRLTDSE